MTVVTLADMATRIGQKLNLIIGGSSLQAEDRSVLEGVISSVYEMLRENEICYWVDDEAPSYLREPLALYITCFAFEDFATSIHEGTAYRQQNEDKALRRIRALVATDERTDKPLNSDYF